MTSNTDRKFISRPMRFSVEDLKGLKLTITRKSDPNNEIESELLDFSRQGMKFRSPVCLRFEETVQVKMKLDNTELEYEGKAQVRHIRKDDNKETFQAGCSVYPCVSDEVISYLAARSGKERRKHARMARFGDGMIHRQGDTEGCKAIVQCISEGGFGAVVEGAFEVGESVKMVIDDFDGIRQRISARVCWQLRDEDFFRVGFSFAENAGYRKLAQCVRSQREFEAKTKSAMRGYSWLLFAAALFVMLAPSVILMSQHFTQDSAVEQVALIDEGQDSSLVDTQTKQSQPANIESQPNVQLARNTVSKTVEPKGAVTLPPSAQQVPTTKITRPLTEPAKKPVQTAASDGATEKPVVTKPLAKPVTKPVTKPVAKKPLTEPEVNTVVKPVTKEPVTDPIAKPVTDPVAKPVTKPVVRQTVETKPAVVKAPVVAAPIAEPPIAKTPVEQTENVNATPPMTNQMPEIKQPEFDPKVVREWLDATGQFRTMASIEKIANEFVVLRLESGDVVRVPFTKLSRNDLEFLLKAEVILGKQ